MACADSTHHSRWSRNLFRPPLFYQIAFLAFLLVTLPISASAKDKPTERLGLDPVLHGIWTVHATSKDRGRTVTTMDEPFVMCRAFATKVKLANGQTMGVDKVMIADDDYGHPMNVVRFDTGVIWAISKNPKSPFFMVQVFSGDEMKETLRFLITIDE